MKMRPRLEGHRVNVEANAKARRCFLFLVNTTVVCSCLSERVPGVHHCTTMTRSDRAQMLSVQAGAATCLTGAVNCILEHDRACTVVL